MTYYDILEISENASDEVVRMAYKALAKKYHPDVFKGDPKEAEEKMKQINEAFEILSDNQKRKQYDNSLHKGMNETYADNASDVQSDPVAENNSKSDLKFPSGAKSGLIIALLSFLSFALVLHPYIENTELYDYSLAFAFRDFAFLNFSMLLVPLFVFAFSKTQTMKNINLLCLFNSVGVWILSLILFVFEITDSISIGWILAIIHYFINRHILLQLAKRDYNINKKTAFASIVNGSLIIIAIVVTLISSDFVSSNTETDLPDDILPNNNIDDSILSFSELSDEKKEKSDFLDENIVFVIEGFENYYYTYDEMIYVTQQIDDYSFWAYNEEQAKTLNYVKSNVNVSNGWSSEKADFLDEYIVFIIDGFGNYYYTYDEMILATQQMDEYSYWAYNIEQAISLGYTHR